MEWLSHDDVAKPARRFYISRAPDPRQFATKRLRVVHVFGQMRREDVIERLVAKRHGACVPNNQSGIRAVDLCSRSLTIIVREEFQKDIGTRIRSMPASDIEHLPTRLDANGVSRPANVYLHSGMVRSSCGGLCLGSAYP